MSHRCLIANVENDFELDPTRTVGIRKRWIGQYNVRFKNLKGRVNALLIKDQIGGIPVPTVDPTTMQVANAYEFGSDVVKVAEFMAWLQLQIDAVIFGNDATAANVWQNRFIDQAYARGITQSMAQLRVLQLTPDVLAGITPASILGTATASLGLGIGGLASNGPIHLDAIRLLYTRNFEELKGIAQAMSQQISRVLVDAMEQGLGIRQIAKNINDRIDKIGLTRAKLLARTETVRAYNIANINNFSDIAAAAGITPMFGWFTAGDGRVRPDHVERNTKTTGRVYTKQQILSLIGEPNCRCGVRAHIDQTESKAA